MKKRLKNKLEKQGRLIRRNPAAFFLGEKRIIEQYLLLQSLNSSHPLLQSGEINEKGRFVFKEHSVKPKHAVEYIDKLIGAAIELGALKKTI